MPALPVPHNTTFTIEMERDQVRLIDRRAGNLSELRKGFDKLHGILKNMPLSKDTAADFQKTRENRGKA
jgi:hypothetical protein